MTYLELAYEAAHEYDRGLITLDEYNEKIKPLCVEINQKDNWVPVEYHQITEEEREENDYPADWAYYIDSPMPEEGQEILITTNTGYVEKCTCLNDGESWYTDDDYDWCGDITAWQPLPEPHHTESEDK